MSVTHSLDTATSRANPVPSPMKRLTVPKLKAMKGGDAMAETVAFLAQRGIPVIGHVGLTPQAVNALGGYGTRGRGEAEARKIVPDAPAIDAAGCFLPALEG